MFIFHKFIKILWNFNLEFSVHHQTLFCIFVCCFFCGAEMENVCEDRKTRRAKRCCQHTESIKEKKSEGRSEMKRERKKEKRKKERKKERKEGRKKERKKERCLVVCIEQQKSINRFE